MVCLLTSKITTALTLSSHTTSVSDLFSPYTSSISLLSVKAPVRLSSAKATTIVLRSAIDLGVT